MTLTRKHHIGAPSLEDVPPLGSSANPINIASTPPATPPNKRPRRSSSPGSDEDEDIGYAFGSDADYEFGYDDEDDSFEQSTAMEGLALLEEDIQVAQAMLADTGIQLRQIGVHLEITLPLVDLTDLARAACGLTRPHPIIVLLDLDDGYRRTSGMPSVTVRHGDPSDGGLETSTSRTHQGFPIGLQLTHVARVFFSTRWSNRGDTFLADLCLRLADRLQNSGNYCQLCDSPLFPGVKPTICGKDLCAYQLETLGLGADLSLFDTDAPVADLLLTAAVAACNDIARQVASPLAMPVNRAADDAHFTPVELSTMFNLLPRVELLSQATGDERLAMMREVNPAAPFAAGWVFATNRAHIVSLPAEKHFSAMKTDHQFQIHTSTRQHAERFEALRSKHGSFFAFHGSGLSNWHNVLRQNLKNASNTRLMSAGAVYGEGIYLGNSSGISRGYLRPHGGWKGSALGEMPVCLALVEVANSSRVHHHMNGQIIVVADESCVTLRYLFVYPNAMQAPTVLAKDLVVKQYRNSTTIAYGSTLEEVSAEGKLLVTTDEYFWDIDEVVAMVEGKNGLFINGYTQLPFAPRDVKAIINHPSGVGRALVKLEEANEKLRQKIPVTVVNRLNSVGAYCRSDTSSDFTNSHVKIAELLTWIYTLDAEVRDALSRAPFTATDSHLGHQFRDTVMHAIELVSSGGECIHRFGDFLRQVRVSASQGSDPSS